VEAAELAVEEVAEEVEGPLHLLRHLRRQAGT